MGRIRKLHLVVFICGFTLSSVLILTTDLLICNRCVGSHIDAINWYISSGIQKVVPMEMTKNFVSTTFDISGLGNLMFQYASLIGIAHESNLIPVIPLDSRLNKIFQLNVTKWNSSRPGLEWGKIVEHRALTYDPVLGKLYIQENVEVVGYIQSWMYFKNTQDVIRNHLKFTKMINIRAETFYRIHHYRMFRTVRKENIVHIGVHIRRGDMLSKIHADYGYTVVDKTYLRKAVTFYERKFRMKTIVFVVCSDDLRWAKANFPPNSHHVIFCPGDKDHVDLAILSLCNHSIITTGTFSWWSGWLTGGHVVYYKGYPRDNSRLQRSFSSHRRDYYPPGWIGL